MAVGISPVAPSFAYWAFISYSHRDEAQATALHRKLETYRVPRAYAGTDTGQGRVPDRLYPCFRDRDELGGAPSLGPVIERALSQSRALVVICSPNVKASKWVNEEIRFFRSLGRGDQIFAYLIDGEPADAFPVALTKDPGSEPLAPDARPGRDGAHAALLKLVAGITGVRYADLVHRDQTRRAHERSRRTAIGGALALLLAVLYVLLSDAGSPVPFGDATRRILDHYGLSVLRPVASNAQLVASASGLREQILASNWAYITKNWKTEFVAGPHNSLDVWSTAQYAAANLHARSRRADARVYLGYLETAFAPGVYRYGQGHEPLGWYGYSDPAPWPEPPLWMSTAIAEALAYPQLLRSGERATWLERLRLSQRGADAFGPHGDNHWDAVPHEDDATEYDTYAAAIALLATLGAKDAGLGWDGSTTRRDAVARATAGWFVATWLPDGQPFPRWNPQHERVDIADYGGLTLQIYGELLRARKAGYVDVPPPMLAAIERRLLALNDAQLEGDRSSVNFREHFKNGRGQDQFSVHDITFPLLPGAIECSARYLLYLEEIGAPRERTASIRRVAARLLNAATNLQNDKSFDRFAPAEAAYFLTSFDELVR